MRKKGVYAPGSKTACRGRDGTGGHPGRGSDGAGTLPASSLIASLDKAQALDVLSEYVSYATELFGNDGWRNIPTTGVERSEIVEKAVKDFGIREDEIESVVSSSYGFIVTTDNLHSDTYGYKSLYHKITGGINYNRIKTIRWLQRGEKKSKEQKKRSLWSKGGLNKRLYMYELGLISENEIYEWFADLVNRQNNTGASIISPSGERIIVQNGRFCNKKGKRSSHIKRVFKEGIGEITDCILLTLTIHEKEVISFMPDNTNLLPVQYAALMIGKWISYFLRRLRQFQKNRDLPWEFVGWTVEFQEGDEKIHHNDRLEMYNGFPHVHMIFKGKWIGDIKEIAELWPYCEPQGVDYMNKTKYERKLREQGKLKPGQHASTIRLINYVTSYVAKCRKAVFVKEEGKKKIVYVHKGYAWLAFNGGAGNMKGLRWLQKPNITLDKYFLKLSTARPSETMKISEGIRCRVGDFFLEVCRRLWKNGCMGGKTR